MQRLSGRLSPSASTWTMFSQSCRLSKDITRSYSYCWPANHPWSDESLSREIFTIINQIKDEHIKDCPYSLKCFSQDEEFINIRHISTDSLCWNCPHEDELHANRSSCPPVFLGKCKHAMCMFLFFDAATHRSFWWCRFWSSVSIHVKALMYVPVV